MDEEAQGGGVEERTIPLRWQRTGVGNPSREITTLLEDEGEGEDAAMSVAEVEEAGTKAGRPAVKMRAGEEDQHRKLLLSPLPSLYTKLRMTPKRQEEKLRFLPLEIMSQAKKRVAGVRCLSRTLLPTLQIRLKARTRTRKWSSQYKSRLRIRSRTDRYAKTLLAQANASGETSVISHTR